MGRKGVILEKDLIEKVEVLDQTHWSVFKPPKFMECHPDRIKIASRIDDSLVG